MQRTHDGLAFRNNPLGIHSLDGQDIVIGKTPRHAAGPLLSQEHLAMPECLRAKQAYYDSGEDDSEPTAELNDPHFDAAIPTYAPLRDSMAKPSNPFALAPAQTGSGGSAKASAAKHRRADPHTKLDSQLEDLGISQGRDAAPVAAKAAAAPQEGSLRIAGIDLSGTGIGSLDFTSNLKMDLGAGFSCGGGMLSRKNTISARPLPPSDSTPAGLAGLKTSVGPSSNPLLIQRLKSIRKQMRNEEPAWTFDAGDYDDDVKRAEGLPDDVLKMIAFSPDSPWLDSHPSDKADGDNSSDAEDDADEIERDSPHAFDVVHSHKTLVDPGSSITSSARGSRQPTPSSRGSTPPFMGKTPRELNPFYAAKLARERVDTASTSVTTLSDISGTCLNNTTGTESELAVDHADGEAAGYGDRFGDARLAAAPHASAAAVKAAEAAATPAIEEIDPISEDDRGRLFLQINKFANMRGLPIDVPRNPRFTLSLDNGLQTVTTEAAPLPSPSFNGVMSAKIGQEFELTVASDLQLVLTVAVSMDPVKPPPRPVAPPRRQGHEPQESFSSASSAESQPAPPPHGQSPIKSMKNLLMRSPRKKQQARFNEKKAQHEERMRQLRKEEAEQEERSRIQHERNLKEFRKRADIWRNITGPRGEYCRGYVFESHYEKDIYGRAQSFAIPLYNEWDKSTNGVPRPVCELQVTMMYVPKLFGSEQIPMSMQQCQKELELARSKRIAKCEGFLTQQGGDCGSMWRRRYFTLNGTEMIGHHEATRKRRALIHLERAIAVEDTLSDDLWCIYEDRSFQVCFDDNEAIGFYADTVEAREMWLKALKETIANTSGKCRTWKDLVFEFEDSR